MLWLPPMCCLRSVSAGTPSIGKPCVCTSACDGELDVTSILLPRQKKRSPGVALPSMAPPPGMLLLQHRCQRRAQVCVHGS